MRFLTDIHEIEEEIYIKRTPVITINVSKEAEGWEGYGIYEGSKVRVATPNRKYPDLSSRCTAHIYMEGENEKAIIPIEAKVISLTCPGSFLKDSFEYQDVVEMVEWSHAPLVKAGDEVIVVFDDPEHSASWIRKMVVGNVSPHCPTVATLRDADEE